MLKYSDKRALAARDSDEYNLTKNGLKWISEIQIFRNIDSQMLKWMLFRNAFLFMYKNCMEHIFMPFNLKIILAFSVHCEYCSIQNFE